MRRIRPTLTCVNSITCSACQFWKQSIPVTIWAQSMWVGHKCAKGRANRCISRKFFCSSFRDQISSVTRNRARQLPGRAVPHTPVRPPEMSRLSRSADSKSQPTQGVQWRRIRAVTAATASNEACDRYSELSTISVGMFVDYRAIAAFSKALHEAPKIQAECPWFATVRLGTL